MIINSKTNIIRNINHEMVELYYNIGQTINELIDEYNLEKSQNKNDYYIEFESENSLANFKLYYKNKLVNIKYKIDNNGKIAFAYNNSKLDCISYADADADADADGTKMSKLTKFRIINYFTKWLNDNHLMSEEITTTLE